MYFWEPKVPKTRGFRFPRTPEKVSPLRHLNVLINLLSDIYKFCPPAEENDADRILSVGFVASKTLGRTDN